MEEIKFFFKFFLDGWMRTSEEWKGRYFILFPVFQMEENQ